MGGEIPGHDALGLEAAPLQVAITAFPMIAEKERGGGERRLPAKHDAGERPARTVDGNTETGGRSGEIHSRPVGGETRALAVGRNEARAVMVDEDADRELRQFGDHGGSRNPVRGGGGVPAGHRGDEKRACAELQRIAEKIAPGGVKRQGGHWRKEGGSAARPGLRSLVHRRGLSLAEGGQPVFVAAPVVGTV